MPQADIAIILIHRIRGIGWGIALQGDRIWLKTPGSLQDELVEQIKVLEPEVIEALSPEVDRGSDDWLAFFDERSAIREHDGGMSKADADHRTFEDCVVYWRNQNPEPSCPSHCASCGKPEEGGPAIIPFGTGLHGHFDGASQWERSA